MKPTNYWTAREFPLDFSNNCPTHQIPNTIQGRTCDLSPSQAEAGTREEESQAPGHSRTHMSLLEATVSPFASSRALEMPEQSPPRSGMPGCPREAESSLNTHIPSPEGSPAPGECRGGQSLFLSRSWPCPPSSSLGPKSKRSTSCKFHHLSSSGIHPHFPI